MTSSSSLTWIEAGDGWLTRSSPRATCGQVCRGRQEGEYQNKDMNEKKKVDDDAKEDGLVEAELMLTFNDMEDFRNSWKEAAG
mmetsp:Transcript_12409/g.20566  ORF Transcript_12409/g.20566 Transcript_12409/m.20566 type:complete len:83 (-) Transcript_12409:1173-1421(-)